MSPGLAGLAVGLVMLAGSIISAPLIARLPRKPLLVTSLLSCSVSLTGLALHLLLQVP